MNQDTRTEFWFLCHARTLVLYHHHDHHNHICETTRHAHTYNTDERVNSIAGASSSQNTSADKRTARFFHTCESEHVANYTIRTSVSDATDSPLSQVTCYISLDTLYLLNLTISTHYIQMSLVDDKRSYTSCYKVRKVGGCEPA